MPSSFISCFIQYFVRKPIFSVCNIHLMAAWIEFCIFANSYPTAFIQWSFVTHQSASQYVSVMQTDFKSSACLAFQNFLLFLPCISWFSWFLCYRVRSPCVVIFHINWKSYLKTIINFLACILFNKIWREKQAQLLFKKKGMNSIFYHSCLLPFNCCCGECLFKLKILVVCTLYWYYTVIFFHW